ncbi:BRcat domain-containing protein [Portibacter lacus]|uniref:Uncharacterized protein n=1 Tax=Portibacter lacus TaxID=1099794 RepID=A0AA37SQA2_9BACT|nr:IBR domain-containing protein [Portibacter lacus]GLR15635.1 hypothetical protein GCM10007940_02500 [Portibacter lacus]
MNKDYSEEYKYKEKLELEDLSSDSEKGKKVYCPSCSEPVPAENLNIHSYAAKCSACNSIFSFREDVDEVLVHDKISQEIIKPEGVELNYFGEHLDITLNEQPWGNLESAIVAFFPLLLMITSLIFIKMVDSTGFSKTILLAILITATIAYISYFFIRKKHKIYIHIDKENLYIERRPRKFIKDEIYSIEEIDQVYIKSVPSASATSVAQIFMIVNGPKGQKHVKLVKQVNSLAKAKYLEQEIERHLGIKDRKVIGET